MNPPDDSWLRRLRDAADAPDLSGTRYELIERIGRGGMGTVYRVRDVELDREVALKVLSTPDPSGSLAARSLREARVLARLEHPNIVPVHDAGTLADGRTFSVMKLVRGRRLDDWVRGGPPLREVLRLFQRICEAVAFAHAHGVVHRDLKPANIMVGAFGEALVMDWGTAKLAGAGESEVAEAPGSRRAGATEHGTVIGTPDFMAPEQADGQVERVDARSDVYALGATLRALLAPPLPRRLAAMCDRACAERPEDRYPSALDFGRDIAAFLDDLPVAAYRENLAERALRVVQRHKVLVALIVAYLAMRIVVLLTAGR